MIRSVGGECKGPFVSISSVIGEGGIRECEEEEREGKRGSGSPE